VSRLPKGSQCAVSLITAVLLLLVALPAGCTSSTGRTGEHSSATTAETSKADQVSLPAWRKIDRVALAGSLGWGQISQASTSGRRVALTFDAGSGSANTPAILDDLRAAGLHCTFFVTGQFAHENPAVMKRIAAEGHEISNHSYSHPRFTTIPAGEVSSQLARTEAAVKASTRLSTKPYFRFPYGEGSDALISQINAEGYLCVLWTIDTIDWDPETTPDTIRSRVAQRVGPGAIVLMHADSPQEAQVLPQVIGDLTAADYSIVTLSEALEAQ
jgi:peptidoglycan/xylan/chitin deacetylase (PgdA/CDA1 family)